MRLMMTSKTLAIFQSIPKIAFFFCIGLTACFREQKIEYLVSIENTLNESVHLCRSEMNRKCYEIKTGKTEDIQFFEKNTSNRWITDLRQSSVSFCGRNVFMPELVATTGIIERPNGYLIRIDSGVEQKLCSKNVP